MELKDIIVIIISGLGLIVSVIALIRDFYTRKKVQELTNLEIEKLRAEKENKMKANLYGYIEDDYFVIDLKSATIIQYTIKGRFMSR